jgi:hypothetical protein
MLHPPPRSPQTMKRRWFQIHLSTAVLMRRITMAAIAMATSFVNAEEKITGKPPSNMHRFITEWGSVVAVLILCLFSYLVFSAIKNWNRKTDDI